jgi:hypothetical protein
MSAYPKPNEALAAIKALRMKTIWMALAATVMVASAQTAQASPIFFHTTLSGLNEVPPNASAGTGFADVMVDSALNILKIDVTFSGLSAPASAAHIHCCLASPFGPGSVIVAVPFTGFPPATSGTYSNTVDLTLAATYNGAFITAHGGTAASAEAALLAAIGSDETYVNIHDRLFPAGEIRGILVPEPVTLSLFGAGFVGAAALRRRKSKA